MRYNTTHLRNFALLIILLLNIFALMINFSSVQGEETEGFTADILRGLGVSLDDEDNQVSPVPRLTSESLSNFPDRNQLNTLPITTSKIVNSFSLPSWGGLGFGFRKNITVDSSQVATDLTNYSLLIDMGDAFDIFGVTQSSGNDIIFTDSSGTILDHELELFDAETSHLVAWIRIPNLSSSSDTQVSMYYGNETIISQQNPSGVWDNGYMAVYHLNDDPASTIYDSTSNNNDGSSFGTVTQEEGPMGNAYYFDQDGGIDDYLRIPQSSSLNLTGNQMTLEGWVYLQFTPVPYDSMIFDKAGDFYNTDGWMMGVDGDYIAGGVGYPTQMNQRINTQNNQAVRVDNGAIYPGRWTYLSVIYDGTTSSYTGYIDASNVYTNSGVSGDIRNVNMDLFIGKRDEAANRVFHGSMDELRISDVARSTGYITTCYNNYNDPEEFYSISSQEPGISNYEKQRTIIIDSSIVSGSSDLSNFPLLLDLYLENAPPNIIFTDGNSGQLLEHEIELFDANYNSSHDHLVVWMKIPTLSSSFDSEIIMYTDSILPQVYSNPDVWTDYTGVWHLGETEFNDEDSNNNAHEDSTNQNNDGDQHGNYKNQSIIGYGQDFDGINDYIDIGDPDSLELVGDSYFTFTGWFYRESTTTDDYIIDKWDSVHGGSEGTGYYLWIDQSDGKLKFQSNDDDDDGFILQSTSNFNTLPIGWYHYAITFHTSPAVETTPNVMQMYINGVNDNAVASLWGIGAPGWTGYDDFNPLTNTETFQISNTNSPFDGFLDEIRITEQILTEDWIRTEVRNQNNLSAYLTVGPEIESQKLWHDAAFNRRKDLKIDSAGFVGTSNEQNIILRPGARGTDYNQWGVVGAPYQHEAVDEVITDDWTTYITLSTNSSTPYGEMFYAVGLPATTPSGTITSVRVYSNARTSGTVTSYGFQHWLRASGNTDTIGGRSLSGSFIVDYDEATTNPFTLQPWQWEDLEDLEFGVWGYVREGASQGYLRVTQVWVVVTFEPDSSYLKNIPITVDIYDSDLKTDVQADGDDIRFYDEYGRKLAHEITEFEQNYNSSHARLTAWVEIPTLSTGGDSYISMYYGNTSLGNQEQIEETWEEYLAVYHLEETPPSLLRDSTASNLDLTSLGSMTSDDRVTGQVGYSIDFDGSNDQLYTTQAVTLGSFTLSSWINFDSGAGWNTILNFDRGTIDWRQFSINDWNPRFDGAGYSYAFGGPYSTFTWYYVVFTYDANSTEFKVYVDGAQSGSTRYLSIDTITDDFQLGAWGTTDWWNGKLDEVRIAADTRSLAWIKAEYANQYDPNTFISIGQEIELAPPIINSFGVDDPGNGNPTLWANVTDHDTSVASVSLRVNTSDVIMTKNATGIWTYPLPSVVYGDYYTYQITNASDINGNYLKSSSTIQNNTFDYDSVVPTIEDAPKYYQGVGGTWDYQNNTFKANISDSWGEIHTVLLEVTTYSLSAVMVEYSDFGNILGFINNSLDLPNGGMNFRIIVNDSGGNEIISSLDSASVFYNHPPIASNLMINTAPYYSNNSLILVYTYWDEDSHLEDGTEIHWYRNEILQGYPNEVPSTALVRGETWWVSVRPHDGIEFGDIIYSSNITIENTVPLVQNIELEVVSDIEKGQSLELSYTWIDADSGDIDHSLVQWYRNISSGYVLMDAFTNKTQVPSNATQRGEKWKVNVTASDNFGIGNSILSIETIIPNTVPYLEVTINNNTVPATVNVDQDLIANYTYFDADNDSIVIVEIQWYKYNWSDYTWSANFSNTLIIQSGNTSDVPPEDGWRVEIRISDGLNYSSWYSSPTIRIGAPPNNPPSVVNLNLDSSLHIAGGFLYVNYTFIDENGDNESDSQFRWYRNGVHQLNLISRNLTTATLVKGDSWYAEVRSKDGSDWGEWNQSSVIIIGNTAPKVEFGEIISSDTPAYTTSTLTANFGSTDVDNNPVSDFIIIWKIGGKLGTEVPNLENKTIVTANYTSKGEWWSYGISVFDGNEWSPFVYPEDFGETPLIIANTKPSIVNVILTGGRNTSDPIYLTYSFFDSDNDSEGLPLIQWFKPGLINDPDANNNETLGTEFFIAGNTITLQIKAFDGEEYSDWTLSNLFPSGYVIIGSSTPTIVGEPLIVGPNQSLNYKADSPLIVNYTASDPDHGENTDYDIELDSDGYVIGALYEWYRNDVLVSAITGHTVPVDYLKKGDTWLVRVKPRDKRSTYGTWENSSTITIQNGNPEVTGIWFETTLVPTDIDIRVQFSYSDIDGDSINLENTSILWFKNGILISSAVNRTVLSSQLIGDDYFVVVSLNSINYQKNDNISVIINPFDGTDWTLDNASTITIKIQNSIPTVSNPSLLAHNRNGTIIYTTDRINLTWVYSDVDGDNESTPIIIWERNDVALPLYANSLFIPSTATTKDEKWDAIIRVHDGTNYSIELSITIFITNSIPVLVDVVLWNNNDLSNNSYSDGSISISSYDFIDADFDSVDSSASFIQWYLNGVYVSLYDNQTSISSSELMKGDYWYAVVQILDLGGVIWSNNYTSQIIYVINKAPEVTSLILVEEPGYLIEDENITIVLTITDPDFNDTDASIIEWMINGTLQPQYTNQREISFIETNPGDNWTIIITPSDGIDNGAIFTKWVIIESRPHIQNLTAIIEQDLDGHFTFGLQVLDARNQITSVKYELFLNGTESDIVDILNSANTTDFWILEYFLSDPAYYNTEAMIEIRATSDLGITSIRTFYFSIIDGVAPRVSGVGLGAWFVKNSNDPTQLSFFADIEEYGAGVANVTLYYYYKQVDGGEGSSMLQDFTPVLMIFNASDANTLTYAVTVPYPQDDKDYEVLYWVTTQDLAGNSNPGAFDIRDYPDRINNERIIQPTGGLPPELLLLAGLAVFLIFVGSVVYVRFIRKPEIIGLDKPLVMKGVPDVDDDEIIENIDRHTLGIVVSFFDQLHGPIPIIVIPEMLKDNYSKLVALSDRSFSGTEFSDNFAGEEFSSYDFGLGEQLRISVISYGFALDKPEARGGKENLTLNILIHKDIFKLIEQFKDEIQEKVHEFHLDMAKDSGNKVIIRVKANEVRKYVSAIVMSYVNIYGTTDLIEEEED
ncbi:hypothetical protein CEE45_10655 [Candidatus Heimdallarchaeota archaeon B3_Heim]|nr:MAG: hypothetical protein CEE45_10655 [Candidatus Heimdallarchaeota archaeon B3_Heim]